MKRAEWERTALNLAVGRVLRMLFGHVPFNERAYWSCRTVVLDIMGDTEDHAPNYARDRMKGAAGD